MTTDQWEVTAADDIDIEEDAAASAPVFVAECKEAQIVKRNGRTQFHQAWEPLSFKQVFNRAKYDFRQDDYTHDWLTSHTKDGKLMGNGTAFGKVREAYAALNVPLTRNEVFRPQLVGKVFKVTRVREAWVPKMPDGSPQLKADGTPDEKYTYYVLPLEMLEEYTPPVNPKVQRYGFEASNAPEQAEATPQQVAALKSATNGKGVEDLMNAILDSNNNLIICEPFMSEAGSGALMERLTGIGARVVNDRVYFAEVGV